MRQRNAETSGLDADFDALLPEHKNYRILIVDDHPVVRRGIRAVLERQPGIEWMEASNGPEAIELAKAVKPDLALVDLTMPDMNGLEVTAAIREQVPETAVLVVSMHFSEELAREVLRNGALGYILKSDADEELLSAVDHVRRRQPFFTTRLAMTMAQNFMAGRPGDVILDENGRPISPLTERETQIVQLLADGKARATRKRRSCWAFRRGRSKATAITSCARCASRISPTWCDSR